MKLIPSLLLTSLPGILSMSVQAAPTAFTRLTPASALFTFNDPTPPIIARFLPGQKFDFDCTIVPEILTPAVIDTSGPTPVVITPAVTRTVTSVEFKVDNVSVGSVSGVSIRAATAINAPAGARPGSVCVSKRAYSNVTPGVHTFKAIATLDDSSTVVSADGNFEIVEITQQGRKAKNIICMIGDGMGIAHRTAARIMKNGVAMGKSNELLNMDTFPATAIVTTASLNSIVTDSSPGSGCYSTGNKANNNMNACFPDDTTANFDNPRVETMGQYFKRTDGKSLGLVTTSDVFDATPGAWASHTSARGAGTGICDQYIDESSTNGLTVLMGGGRKWFLPSTTVGSARSNSNDYALSSDITSAWGVATGVSTDNTRDLIADAGAMGFTYAADKTAMLAAAPTATKLLGLFSYSNMNVAQDKIAGRRGQDFANPPVPGAPSSQVAANYGFPDQPMLDEMTDVALTVLSKNPRGFVLMIEGASIDKQAHNMDSERWILDTIEFDNAVGRVKNFAAATKDTLVIVVADHECAGINIIGSSLKTNAQLNTILATPNSTAPAVPAIATGLGTEKREAVVGHYDAAGFPSYALAADGYPVTTDVDYKMIIGYAGNADRFEDWQTNNLPLRDSQQPTAGTPYGAIVGTLPSGPTTRDATTGYFVSGQASTLSSGGSAVHTASDVPLSAMGRGSVLFSGVIDNTDVFFKAMQAGIGGSK